MRKIHHMVIWCWQNVTRINYNKDVEDLEDSTGFFQEDAREEVHNYHLSKSDEITLYGRYSEGGNLGNTQK